MEGRKDGRMNGWKEGRMKEWKEVRMGGRMEGWKEGWKEGRKERRKERNVERTLLYVKLLMFVYGLLFRLTYPYMLTFTPIAKKVLDEVVFICLVSPDTLM